LRGTAGSATDPAAAWVSAIRERLDERDASARSSGVPGYRFERLTGKSHWLLEECPDEVSSLVLAEAKENDSPLASRL
jgi:hypothetical protein